jgi:hypothetical protein
LAAFQFRHPIHCRQDTLDGGSAHRKASTYTQDNTNTKYMQISVPRVRFEATIPVSESVTIYDYIMTIIIMTIIGVTKITENYTH